MPASSTSTSKRAESPTGCPAAGTVETHVGGSTSRRMRPAPVTSSGPGGAMSSALRDELVGDRVGVARLTRGAVALHQERRRARRVRRRGRGADHGDAGPDGGRCGRDDIGLQAAVLGRALRGVVRSGVALPVARAHGERAARIAGRRDARLGRGLVAELEAAAEDLEVADHARRALLDAQPVGAGRDRPGSRPRRRAARRRSGALGVHDRRARRGVGDVELVAHVRGRDGHAALGAAAPVERRPHADADGQREREVAAAVGADVGPAVLVGIADDALPVAARVVAGRVGPEDAGVVRAVDRLRRDAGAVERAVEERVRVHDDVDARLAVGAVDEPVDGLRELELGVVVDERVARAGRDVPHDLRDVRAVAGRLVVVREARRCRACRSCGRTTGWRRSALSGGSSLPSRLRQLSPKPRSTIAMRMPGAVEPARLQRVGADALDALRDDLVGQRHVGRADAATRRRRGAGAARGRACRAPAAASRRAP